MKKIVSKYIKVFTVMVVSFTTDKSSSEKEYLNKILKAKYAQKEVFDMIAKSLWLWYIMYMDSS